MANPALQWCFPARGVATATPRPQVASPLSEAKGIWGFDILESKNKNKDQELDLYVGAF